MTSIHERIKEKRLLAGFTQKRLADMLGFSKTAVSLWERGQNKPSPEHYAELSKVLNVNEEWLISGVGEPNSKNEHLNTVYLAPFFKGVKVSAGYGCMPDSKHFSLFPIPRCALKFQSDLSGIFCVVASGTSMEPALFDGSVVAINQASKDIRDGKMYVIRQGDLLRVKLLYLYPHELHVESINLNYDTEIYKGDAINDIEIIGRVFWYSSVSF